MIFVVVFQNCMDFVEGETGSCIETCVTCDVGGNEVSIKVENVIDIKEEFSIKVEDAIDIKEEFSIKVEEPIDIKDEIPEAKSFLPIMTEHEVRLWGVCVRWQLMLLGHLLLQKEIVKLRLTTSSFYFIVGAIYV
jgi:hypothetical protein